MPRSALAASTRLTVAGIDASAVAAAADLVNGNTFPWGKHRLFYVNNAAATPVTVTFVTPGTVGRGGLAISDATATIPAGTRKLCGPFGPEFRQADGTVAVDYTGAAASVTVAALDANPAE